MDVVCGIFRKTHISGSVSVFYRHSQLPPVCDRGEGVDYRVTLR